MSWATSCPCGRRGCDGYRRAGRGVALGYLQRGANPRDHVQADYRQGHLTRSLEMGRELPPRILVICATPIRGLETGIDVAFGHLPERLHDRAPIAIEDGAGCVQRGRTRIDEMQDAVRRAPKALAAHALHGLGLQVRTSQNTGAVLVSRVPRSIDAPLSVSFSVANAVGRRAPFQSKVEVRIASAKSPLEASRSTGAVPGSLRRSHCGRGIPRATPYRRAWGCRTRCRGRGRPGGQ